MSYAMSFYDCLENYFYPTSPISKGRVRGLSTNLWLWDEFMDIGWMYDTRWSLPLIDDLAKQVIKERSSLYDSYGFRSFLSMYRDNDSENRYYRPSKEDYVLSDNTKRIFTYYSRVYGKQEKITHKKR